MTDISSEESLKKRWSHIKLDLEQKLQERWSHIRLGIDLIDFKFGDIRIEIDSKFARELGKGEKEIKKVFENLCMAFDDTCYKCKMPRRGLDIIVRIEDEFFLDRAYCNEIKNQENGSYLGGILIPMNYFERGVLWWINFLHELSHLWIPGGVFPRDKNYISKELDIDLVAISVLAELIPRHKSIYRETVKTTLLGKQGRDLLGRDLYREILDNPQVYLKKRFKKGRLLKSRHKLRFSN